MWSVSAFENVVLDEKKFALCHQEKLVRGVRGRGCAYPWGTLNSSLACDPRCLDPLTSKQHVSDLKLVTQTQYSTPCRMYIAPCRVAPLDQIWDPLLTPAPTAVERMLMWVRDDNEETSASHKLAASGWTISPTLAAEC